MATHRLTGTRVAIKKIPKSLTSQLTREIHHHRLLHHQHILHLYEVLATESHIWLATELCTGGELFDYLVERGRLLEGEGRKVFGELVVAVGIMHQNGTVHRDIKLENVLLDGECRVKLGDLGFAREWVRGSRLLETYCGTTGYASPEMLQGKKYSGEGEKQAIGRLGLLQNRY
jgi:serine/threonine protein kinase